MFALLKVMLGTVIKSGSLEVRDAQGTVTHFGDGSGPKLGMSIADRLLERRLAFDPELAAGEGYMQGRLVIEEGTAYDLISLFMRNAAAGTLPPWVRGLNRLRLLNRRRSQSNRVAEAEANVRHHYDIDPRLYGLFLDSDQQYSCAYFEDGAADLEEAQRAKKRHIAAKLALQPGQRVLDVGSGWGGLALYLARTAGSDVTGITLSGEQLRLSRERAQGERLDHCVRFRDADWRQIEGRYDRIVSVGMFEHVGVPQYQAFFMQVAKLLADDGVALIHTIGRSDPPGETNPFIKKYIFPGGYIPALSEMMEAIEASGLIVSDVEVLRLHYAETLRAWRERFLAHINEARAIAGEDFCRMWEWYLAGAEASFRYQGFVVYQVQLVKDVHTLPLTRGYIGEAEAGLERAESAASPPQPSAARRAG